jgi:hypothetical protein
MAMAKKSSDIPFLIPTFDEWRFFDWKPNQSTAIRKRAYSFLPTTPPGSTRKYVTAIGLKSATKIPRGIGCDVNFMNSKTKTPNSKRT